MGLLRRQRRRDSKSLVIIFIFIIFFLWCRPSASLAAGRRPNRDLQRWRAARLNLTKGQYVRSEISRIVFTLGN